MDKAEKNKSKKNDLNKPINILANPDVQKGVYTNVALIHHTKNEFIMDFLLQFGGEAQLVSRVILSPSHMKALQEAINQNIEKYNQENK
jgi:hypothetical protein